MNTAHSTSHASPHGLGRLVVRSQASVVTAWFVFAAGMALLLAWAGLSTGFVSVMHTAKRHDGAVWIGPLVMALFFVPIGLILAIKGYRGRVLRVDLHEGGVAFQDTAGRKAFVWLDIQAVHWERSDYVGDLGMGIDVTTRRVAKLTIESRRRETIVVDERFPDHVAFGARVRDAAAEGMLPAYDAAIAAGQRVYCGPVGLDSWGLHLATPLPWHAIASVRWVSDGPTARYVVIGSQGVPVGEIHCPTPNEVILQILLTRFGKLAENNGTDSPVGDELVATVRRMLSRQA